MNLINTIKVDGTVYNAQAQRLTDFARTVYSRELMWRAQPNMAFLQFADIREELGKESGDTIQMLSYKDLSRGKALTEDEYVKTDALQSLKQTLTVQEHAKMIAISELTLQTSFTDVMEGILKSLSRNVALTIDCDIRDVACTGAVINNISTPTVYGRKDNTVTPVTAPGSVTSTHVLSTTVIKDAVELLATANAPKFAGGYYVCVIHPHQARTLRDDNAWVDVQKYASPENLLTGEIGKIESVRFIESTLMPNGAAATTEDSYDATLANAGASSIDLYKAVMFGESYYGFAVGLPVELRDEPPSDAGRKHEISWYAIYGAGVLNPDRGVIIVTA